MTRLRALKKLETLLPNITNDINKVALVIESDVIDALKQIHDMYELTKEDKTKAKKNKRKRKNKNKNKNKNKKKKNFDLLKKVT